MNATKSPPLEHIRTVSLAIDEKIHKYKKMEKIHLER